MEASLNLNSLTNSVLPVSLVYPLTDAGPFKVNHLNKIVKNKLQL